jgi:hypothetical protein
MRQGGREVIRDTTIIDVGASSVGICADFSSKDFCISKTNAIFAPLIMNSGYLLKAYRRDLPTL